MKPRVQTGGITSYIGVKANHFAFDTWVLLKKIYFFFKSHVPRFEKKTPETRFL